MAHDMTLLMPPLLVVALAFALGAGAGGAFYAALWWNTRLFLSPRHPAWAFGLQLLRLAGLGGVLALIAMQGSLALLASALGVLAARAVTLRRFGARA